MLTAFVVLFILAVSVVLLGLALMVIRQASRPRPALPLDCGDCRFMIPKARIYRRETIEDDQDGLIHYLCQQRWIEVTPASPRCALGRSKTRSTIQAA